MRGWSWTFAGDDPELPERLSTVLEGWDYLEERAGASVLKANLLRKVISLPRTDDHPALVIKRYHTRSLLERWKYFVVPSRAQREWDALRVFRSAGISGPRPLAFGEVRRGGTLASAGLIMETLENVDTLPEALANCPVGSAARHELFVRVGREIGRMHAAGVDHADLHAGNFMVDRASGSQSASGTGGGQVHILDLHATHLGAQLPDRRRVANLSRLFHSLSDALDYPASHALIDGYRSAEGLANPTDPRRWLPSLERRARRLENVRLRSRSKRCWKTSSEFVAERRGLWEIHRRRELDPALLEPYFRDEFALDRIYKDRPDQIVGSTTLMTEDGLRKIVVKTRTYSRWSKRLSYCFIRGPLERAWGASRALDVRGIPNPRSLALMTERRFGLPHKTVLITEHAGAADPLHQNLFERFLSRSASRADRRMLHGEIAELARLVRRLHDTGIYHRDLNPMNFLIGRDESSDAGAARFLLVDLDSIHLGRRLDRRRRRKNLVQLGLLPEGHITTRERLRFLRDYDRGDRRYFDREWIAALSEAIADATVRIIARLSREEAAVGADHVGHEIFQAGSQE